MTVKYDILTEIFEEERKKLRLPEVEVIFLSPPPIEYYESLAHWRVCFERYSTKAIRKDDGSFCVEFNPLSFKSLGRFRRRARHELYHIYRDRHRNNIGLLRYLLISEPTSMLYARFGVKL